MQKKSEQREGKEIPTEEETEQERGIDRKRRGRRRRGGKNLGPGGYCICPSCGEKAPHQRDVPCYQIRCPKCDTKMIREETYSQEEKESEESSEE